MKKIICFCIVINILLLVGCQNSGGKVVKLTNNNYTDYLSVQLECWSTDTKADANLIIESKDDKYIFEDLVVEAKFDWECKKYQYESESGSGQIKVDEIYELHSINEALNKVKQGKSKGKTIIKF